MVSGAVRRNRLLNKPSNAEVENEMKIWLRQSSDCSGGRRTRERCKGHKSRRDYGHRPSLEFDDDVEDDC